MKSQALPLDHFLVFFKGSACLPCTGNIPISQGLTLGHDVLWVPTTSLNKLISTNDFNHLLLHIDFWCPSSSPTIKSVFLAIYCSSPQESPIGPLKTTELNQNYALYQTSLSSLQSHYQWRTPSSARFTQLAPRTRLFSPSLPHPMPINFSSQVSNYCPFLCVLPAVL